MFLELGLFLSCATCMLLTYHQAIKTGIYKVNFGLVPLFCIILPLIEESLFRHSLVDYTKHLWYYKELNALLFGLTHLLNYYSIIGISLMHVVIQSIATSFLGFYLVNLNNLGLAIIVHGLFNGIIILSKLVLFCNRKYDNPRLDEWTNIFYVPKGRLRRTKSLNDIKDGWKYNNVHIKKDKVRPDIIDSIKKYNEIKREIDIKFEDKDEDNKEEKELKN